MAMNDSVSRRDFLAVLRMLVRRATPEDIALANERPGHWLNEARAELAPQGLKGE